MTGHIQFVRARIRRTERVWVDKATLCNTLWAVGAVVYLPDSGAVRLCRRRRARSTLGDASAAMRLLLVCNSSRGGRVPSLGPSFCSPNKGGGVTQQLQADNLSAACQRSVVLEGAGVAQSMDSASCSKYMWGKSRPWRRSVGCEAPEGAVS